MTSLVSACSAVFSWPPVNSPRRPGLFLTLLSTKGCFSMASQVRNVSSPESGTSGMQSARNMETLLAFCARLRCSSSLTTPALLNRTLGWWLGCVLCARACILAVSLSLSFFLSPPPFNASTCEIAQLLADPLGHGFLSRFVTLGLGICLGKGGHWSCPNKLGICKWFGLNAVYRDNLLPLQDAAPSSLNASLEKWSTPNYSGAFSPSRPKKTRSRW